MKKTIIVSYHGKLKGKHHVAVHYFDGEKLVSRMFLLNKDQTGEFTFDPKDIHDYEIKHADE